MPDRISVLLVEDMALVAEAISAGLKASFDFEVEIASTHDEALARIAARGSYDAILLDFSIPGGDPFEALEKLTLANAGRTALFSGISDPTMIASARQAGAVAFLSKDTPLPALGKAIRAIAGKSLEDDPAKAKSVATLSGPQPPLKARELKVLALLAQGLDAEAAGVVLGVDPAIIALDTLSLQRKFAADTVDAVIEKARRVQLI